MDMKRILQAMDGASSKPVEGADSMAKFLSIIDTNANVQILQEGKNPHKVSLPVQMAMQHYQASDFTTVESKPTIRTGIRKYYQDAEQDIQEQQTSKRQLINQYASTIAERVLMREGKQTDAGAGFWDKHRGEDVRVWEATDSKQLDPDIFEDLDSRIIAREAKKIVPSIRAKQTPEGYVYLKTADGLSLVIGCNIADGGIDINIGSQPMEATSSGPHKGAITEIIQAVYAAAVKQYGTPSQPGYLSVDHDAGHGVWQHIAQKLGLQYDAHMVKENFADGKNPGRKWDRVSRRETGEPVSVEADDFKGTDGKKHNKSKYMSEKQVAENEIPDHSMGFTGGAGPGIQSAVAEAPLDFDKENPSASTIHGHQGVNPASVEARIMRARGQLRDLAAKAESNELLVWESIARHFPELAMNIEQIRHGIEELAKIRKMGGRRTGNIPKDIGEEISIKEANAKKRTLKNSNPCWKGYHPVGTKQQGGRTVPNCVPKE